MIKVVQISFLFFFILNSLPSGAQNFDKLLHLTNEYIEAGGYLTAGEWADQALDSAKRKYGTNHYKYIFVQSRRALIHTRLANYEKADKLYNEIFKWYDKSERKKGKNYIYILTGSANLYMNMGLFKEAEINYLKGVRLKQLSGDQKSLAISYNNLGNLFTITENYPKAEEYFLKSIEIKKADPELRLSYAYSLSNLAELYEKMGKDSISFNLFLETLEIKKEMVGENHLSFARTLKLIANRLARDGYELKAQEYYEHVDKVFKWKLGEKHPEYNEFIYDLAVYKEKQGKYVDAQIYYYKVLDNLFVQIEQYFPTLTEREKLRFYEQLKSKIERFDSFAMKRYKADHKILYRVYNNQLRTKALVLNELNKIKLTIAKSQDEDLKKLYKEWQSKKNDYASTVNTFSADKAPDQQNGDPSGVDLLEKQLALKSSDFKHHDRNSHATWKDIYRKLKSGEAAVEVIRIKDELNNNKVSYAALVLKRTSRNSMQLVHFDNGFDMENGYYRNYMNSIQYKIPDKKSYGRYWEPISKKLGNIDLVYFSPDGIYNRINLNTLCEPDSSTYLLNDINIKLVTKTSEILDFSARDTLIFDEPKVAGLLARPAFSINESYNTDEAQAPGTPRDRETQRYIDILRSSSFEDLPGTETEIHAIQDLMEANGNWEVEILKGKDATEANLKKFEKSNPSVLHLATHGFFVEAAQDSLEIEIGNSDKFKIDPLLRSGVLLAGATNYYKDHQLIDGEDGILTAYEAACLNLDGTDLVILSACETGKGKITKGEGVFGMFRALRIAGAKTVIMSLWKVDDAATSLLMKTFYEEWFRSGKKHQAFQKAQNKVKLEYKDPYYWGAFVIVGE